MNTVSKSIYSKRISRGWTELAASTTPVRKYATKYKLGNLNLTVSNWIKFSGMNPNTFKDRFTGRKWSLKKSLLTLGRDKKPLVRKEFITWVLSQYKKADAKENA